MGSRGFVSLFLLFTLLSSSLQALAEVQSSLMEIPLKVSTPFSTALETLQNQINYTFKSVGLLRRAMTHTSFSEENNKALSILGASVMETSIALQSVSEDVDISAKDLNLMIAEVSKVDGSCNADGTRLGLQRIVRVSRKTNITAPAVVCGAFRAIFGAIAVDARSSDEAGRIYVKIHSGVGKAATVSGFFLFHNFTLKSQSVFSLHYHPPSRPAQQQPPTVRPAAVAHCPLLRPAVAAVPLKLPRLCSRGARHPVSLRPHARSLAAP